MPQDARPHDPAAIVSDEHAMTGVIVGDVIQIAIERLVDGAEVLAEALDDEPARGVLVARLERPDAYGGGSHT